MKRGINDFVQKCLTGERVKAKYMRPDGTQQLCLVIRDCKICIV